MFVIEFHVSFVWRVACLQLTTVDVFFSLFITAKFKIISQFAIFTIMLMKT